MKNDFIRILSQANSYNAKIDYVNSIAKDVKIKRSNRKSIGLQITKKCEIIVTIPQYFDANKVTDVLFSRVEWIKKNIAFVKEQTKNIACEKLTPEEIADIKTKSKEILADKVKYYADKIGVTYNKITIKKLKTCWGSCSSKGNLNFNFLLALMPDDVINYVVIHELCHRLEMNHSRKFWFEVSKVMPDYQIKRNWLKFNGIQYMSKVYDD